MLEAPQIDPTLLFHYRNLAVAKHNRLGPVQQFHIPKIASLAIPAAACTKTRHRHSRNREIAPLASTSFASLRIRTPSNPAKQPASRHAVIVGRIKARQTPRDWQVPGEAPASHALFVTLGQNSERIHDRDANAIRNIHIRTPDRCSPTRRSTPRSAEE